MVDVHIDAATFQKPLGQLAEVLAQKVKREAPKLLSAPPFVAFDLHVLIRQAMYIYDLLFYLNADERRHTDSYWKPGYTIAVLPLVRNMIDCLYSITAILQDPAKNGPGSERADTRMSSGDSVRIRSGTAASRNGMNGSQQRDARSTSTLGTTVSQ